MKSKEPANDLRHLSLSIGDFIRYWGFRRVHGAIWTQLYLSIDGLSCTELAGRLKFSKALISPALAELEDWKLIQAVQSPDDKTKLYCAQANVHQVIQHVLKTRESPLMEKITQDFDRLEKHSQLENLDKDRLQELGEMIGSASMMLKFILNLDNLIDLPSGFESKKQ